MIRFASGLIGALAAILPVIPVAAQDTGLDFLQLGPNAEAMALGDAFTSRASDAYATYWNPAGLATEGQNSVAISHHIWVADVRTYAAATRLGLGRNGAIGFAVTATGTGDIEARDQPGDPSGLFGAQFLSIGGSYGRALGPLRAGIGVKYLSEEIFTASSNGYAFDFGLQTDLLDGGLALGASLLNVGSMTQLGAVATQLPRMMRIGAAVYPFQVLAGDDEASIMHAFLLSEISHVFPSETTRIHMGVGAEVMELVMLRVGYVTNDELRSFTFGLGLGYEAFQVDYAFLPFESGFDGPGHVISLIYNW